MFHVFLLVDKARILCFSMMQKSILNVSTLITTVYGVMHYLW